MLGSSSGDQEIEMSTQKSEFVCPKCKQPRHYTPKTLEEGVCRNCKEPFSPDDKEKIRSGIKEVSDARKITKVLAVIDKGPRK
jgi:transcription initiation factor IIE alpha subunit